MQHIVVNPVNASVAFGPFSADEAGTFVAVWQNLMPNLIVIPLNYRPVTRDDMLNVAQMMDATSN